MRRGTGAVGFFYFHFEKFYLVMNINTYDISTITTILKYFVQWPKRMGHETDTVYVKSSPIFCSKNAMGYVG